MGADRPGAGGDDVVLVPGPWTHRQVSAHGARFHTVELGDGPLVLLLHGFPMFWWTWRHHLPVLAAAGYRAVAMDLRGYAGSDKTPRGYDPYTLAGDVAGVIRSLGHERAVVIGHGWGGSLGWTLGALHPDALDRLVVVSAAHPCRMRAALAHDSEQRVASRHVLGYQRPRAPEKALTRDGAAAVEDLLRRWSARDEWLDPDTAARYRAALRIEAVAHCALEYHRWAVRSMLRPDGRRFARRMRTPIGAPVLHLHGTADPVVLAATAAGAEEHVSGPYTFQALDGVGHFPQEEAPEVVSRVLLPWLDTGP